MANQDLSKVTTVPTASINNVKTFLAVMNDGSIQQMTKADMASVLGELIGTATTEKSGLKPTTDYFQRGTIRDANLATKEGIYVLPSGSQNSPTEDYSVIIVNVNSPYILQELRELNNSGIFRRKSLDNGNKFSTWI